VGFATATGRRYRGVALRRCRARLALVDETLLSFMSQVTVRIPASTSNLGPGFDCLGLALKLYNRVTIRRDDASNAPKIAREAAQLFFKKAKRKSFRFACTMSDHIPQRRGLGSSASVRAGILVGLNDLAGKPLHELELFELCSDLEGHPDNAAPALFGGFTVSNETGVQRFDVGRHLRCVLLVPELEVETKKARRILSKQISLPRAIGNIRGASTITAAFVSQDYEAARGAFGDSVHQPARTKLVPFLPRVIAAAEKAGAIGAFLSGSGSTIAAVATSNADRIARSMRRAGPTKARIIIVATENTGAFGGISRRR